MLIDCDTCIARDHACGDCVITVLLDLKPAAPEPLELDAAEEAAIGSLADAGLVPPLRLVPDSSRVIRDIA
ncbi:MAG: hypothetical protein ABR571_02565 [Jatrophihabitans sp.]|uniref:hypothetical protein n=1 Tax=Jatrophihabitans sp. TaxID=1932789 RepID=UPI0039128A22